MAQPKMIRARYVGLHPRLLYAPGAPYYDAAGNMLVDLEIKPGQTLMMPEAEIRGMTYWHDPQHIRDSEFLGVGHVTKKIHEGMSREQLVDIGYEYHEPRPDFVALDDEPAVPVQESKEEVLQ